MTTTAAHRHAMQRALNLAATPGVPLGPNPRVGCVLLDADGVVLAEGYHRGAGTPHAEADALTRAGERARGATAVVTLEPCNHTGRTGPCSGALIAAGVTRVIYAQADPNPEAAGGAQTLRAAGVRVEAGLLAAESAELNQYWTFGLAHARPFVTWKFATTLDGRSAAADGTSRWVSNEAARLDTHRMRGQADAMLVGANTVEIDDPELSVRDGEAQPLPHQPLRAVMGERDLDPDRRIFNDVAETVHLRTRDPHAALAQLFAHSRRHVYFEGGPTLAAGFLQAGLVDRVITYVAPMLLGAGTSAVGELGISTIADAQHLTLADVTVLGDDGDQNLRLTMQPHRRKGA